MSTRANIVVKDGGDELWFYKHSDGYPEGVIELLSKFMKALKEKKIRNNISQSAGWLIVFGHNESVSEDLSKSTPEGGSYGWKVGTIEPTTGEHGDIEYLYTIDLKAETVTVKDIYNNTEKEISILE